MSAYTYIREYSQDDRIELDHLLQSSINKLPCSLSSPIEKFTQHVKKENYGRAMNYAIDFFEISVQYLSCILIALIQKKEEEDGIAVKHKEIIRAIQMIDTKRPLSFGDWVQEIFFPLLKAASKRLPDDPLTICLNKNMFISGGNLIQGSDKEPSIVKIRNEYKGHSTTLSEEIYKGVVYTLEPRIFAMLEAVAPLREWTSFSCREQVAPNQFRVNLLNGCNPNKEKILESTQTLEPCHYYICQGQFEIEQPTFIDVFPLIFCNEKGYVYVIQSLKEKSISYISSNENAATFTDDCWNEALDKRLQKTVPSFDVAKELNCDEIKAFTENASRKFLEHAYKEKKYNQELFVDRSKLSEYFRDFQESDKNLFPMLGEAGQGKTNQLCYWTEKLIEQNTGVVIFNSSGFSEHTLSEKINDIFGISKRYKPIKPLLVNIHKKIAEKNEKIYFFFDAINECLSYKGSANNAEGPLDLYNDVYRLLISEEYPNFKVLFTCRNYTWKNLILPKIPKEDNFTFHTKDEEEIAVRGFTDDELNEAYSIYRELYQMNTSFTSLSRSSTIRLKDPLVLKIACTNFLGMELPSTMLSYTSISLFEKMLQDISRSYAGNKQCSILKELARYILQEYEKGIPADSISDEILRQAYSDKNSQLHEMAKLVYKNDDMKFCVAYGELLNKPERPVLRHTEKDDGTGQLQFIYERFLEFMLASVFIERERKYLSNREKNISVETFVNTIQRSSTNVVFMGAMRNALIMDYMYTQNLSVIIELIGKYGDNSDVMLLITETLNVLIRENYETQVFALIEQLLCHQPEDGETLIQSFNAVQKKIQSNQADDHVISEHNRLSNLLAPITHLRKLASVSVVNGLFLTDYFNEGLYNDSPYRLLWMLMSDPIINVRNDTCLYVYYLSSKTHTLEHSLIKENLTQRIINEMYGYIKSNPLLKIAFAKQPRNQSVMFFETASQLNLLLIIDALLAENESQKKQVGMMVNETHLVLKHLTLNYNLVRLLLPFFNILLRRQVASTSMYVNNIIEYQTFWDDNVIPKRSDNDEWSRESFREILIFIFHYSRYYKHNQLVENNSDMPDFSKYHNRVLSAYNKGDSFSYFVLERIMVIMATCSYEHIRPIINTFFTDAYRQTEWFDYSQMSMLYILFQASVHADVANEEIISLYSRECEDWTRRCKGIFRGRNSYKANPTKMYKRNVMNWYCIVYCKHSGDAVIRPGDERSVPVFYKLLDDAIHQKDKELLYHLLENISELVSDYGYIQTTLELLKYILIQFDSVEKVAEFDKIKLERGGVYQDDLVTLVGKVLSTAKHCFSAEVGNFIKKDLVGLKFPGIPKYREEILNYNPSGETLFDLLTHRFGNCLMKSLLNEEAIGKFVHEALSVTVDSPNCFKWLDKLIRLLFRDIFKVKL